MRNPIRVPLATLLLAATCATHSPAQPATPPTPRITLPAEAELREAVKQLLQPPANPKPPTPQELGDQFDALLARYKPADFDPVERARELPAGIEPAFTEVRDRIRFESYPGVLRGSKGAYAARAANAADRSLLLATLLKEKKIATRFVRGRLPDDKAEVLFARIFEKPTRPADAQRPGEGSADLVNRVAQRARRDYAVLEKTLPAKPLQGASPDHAAVIAEIRDHVWLQADAGGGKWIDLDTAFPDAKPGQAFGDAQATAATLPDEMFQRMTIRLIVERLDGGALKRETTVEIAQPVVDLIDHQLFVLHLPPSAIRGLGSSMSGAATQWTPVLWIDGTMNHGKPIAFSAGVPTPAGKSGGVLDDALGVLSPDPPAPKADASPRFVSESLEFELTLPGGAKEVTRRVLSDCASAAWRMAPPDPAKLDPLPADVQGPLAAQAIHNIWLSAATHDLWAYANALQLLRTLPPPPAPNAKGGADAPDIAMQLWPLAIQNLSCLLPTDQLILPALNDDPAARFYLDSPRILVFSVTGVSTGADQYRLDSQIDWRRDKVRGVAKDPAALASVARHKRWFGVLEGALEHEIMAGQAAALGGTFNVVSASALLRDGAAIAIQPNQAAGAWEGLAPNRETAARIATALKGGETLLVPADVLKGGDAGWWAVSPQGDTRAVAGGDLNWGRLDGAGRYTPGGSGQSGGGGGSWGNVGGKSQYIPNKQYNPAARNQGPTNEYFVPILNISLPGFVIFIGLGGILVVVIWAVIKYIIFR